MKLCSHVRICLTITILSLTLRMISLTSCREWLLPITKIITLICTNLWLVKCTWCVVSNIHLLSIIRIIDCNNILLNVSHLLDWVTILILLMMRFNFTNFINNLYDIFSQSYSYKKYNNCSKNIWPPFICHIGFFFLKNRLILFIFFKCNMFDLKHKIKFIFLRY